MPKPNPLAQGLNRARPAPPVLATSQPLEPRELTPKSTSPRAGRVLVGGHFAPEVQTALKVIAAEERTTVQALLAEGINTVLAKRGKPEVAGLPTS